MSRQIADDYLKMLAGVDDFDSRSWLTDDDIQSLVRELLELRSLQDQAIQHPTTKISEGYLARHWAEK